MYTKEQPCYGLHALTAMCLLQVVDKTTRNALDILDWIGLDHIG